MHIFFDESYDQPHKRYLLLGMLFAPTRALSRRFEGVKQQFRTKVPGRDFEDVKYSKTSDLWRSQVALKAIDEFMAAECYFRSIVIDTQQKGFSWDFFGHVGMPGKLKRGLGYNKFTERLLFYNSSGVSNAVMLTDRLSRCDGDNCREYLWGQFGPAARYGTGAPVLHHIQEVDTALPQYHMGQMCDILLGSILGDLLPPINANKLAVVDHLRTSLAVPSFKPTYWQRLSKAVLDVRHPKFQVWHWRPNTNNKRT